MSSPAQPVSGTAGYIALPVTTDPDAIAAAALAYLAAQLPGWVAREGHLEVWLIRALGRMVAESAKVAAQVPLSVFQYFGTQLLQLPPLAGAPAQVGSTWTMVDTAGHTIPAGTVVAYRTSPSSSVLLVTTASVTVPAGSSATGAGAVNLAAVELGAAGNGLPAGPLQMVDSLAFVAAVVSTGTTAGGVDVETQAAYLNRLSAQLQLLAPRPILAADFAALARNQPGVARAAALDGYNPADSTSGNARMVAVAVVDAAGAALSTAQKNIVAAALAAQREANFIVNVIDPTYTTIRISAQVTTVHGASVAAVNTACVAALTDFLSPAKWGGGPTGWVNTPTVRLLTVGQVLGNVSGVQYVTGVQLAAGAGTLAATDVGLSGPVPLPQPGAITVSVTAG